MDTQAGVSIQPHTPSTPIQHTNHEVAMAQRQAPIPAEEGPVWPGVPVERILHTQVLR